MEEITYSMSITINDDDIYVSVNNGMATASYSKKGKIRFALGYSKITFPRTIQIKDERNDVKPKHT